MSTIRVTCTVVYCDSCRTAFDETGDECVIHFIHDDDILHHLADNGWTITSNGDHLCNSCSDIQRCDDNGHDWEHWRPCHCRGAIPEHRTHGCGLYRRCRRTFCPAHETATLATLPTIDEPQIPGR